MGGLSVRVRKDKKAGCTWPTKTIRVREWAPTASTVREWGGYTRRRPKAVTLADMRPGRTYGHLVGRVVERLDWIRITSGNVGIIGDQEGAMFGCTVELQLS